MEQKKSPETFEELLVKLHRQGVFQRDFEKANKIRKDEQILVDNVYNLVAEANEAISGVFHHDPYALEMLREIVEEIDEIQDKLLWGSETAQKLFD